MEGPFVLTAWWLLNRFVCTCTSNLSALAHWVAHQSLLFWYLHCLAHQNGTEHYFVDPKRKLLSVCFFLTTSSVSLSSQDPTVGPEIKLLVGQHDGCCQGDVFLTEPICQRPCARGAGLFWIWRVCWHARSIEHNINPSGSEKKWINNDVCLSCSAAWGRVAALSVSIRVYACCWDEWYWCSCTQRRSLTIQYPSLCQRRKSNKLRRGQLGGTVAHRGCCCCSCVCESERNHLLLRRHSLWIFSHTVYLTW